MNIIIAHIPFVYKKISDFITYFLSLSRISSLFIIFLLIFSISTSFLIGLINISLNPIFKYSSLYSYLLSLLRSITGILKFLISFKYFSLLIYAKSQFCTTLFSLTIKKYVGFILHMVLVPCDEPS